MKIMHRCIRHLLEQNDEDNLECLCKLLTTIGKDLESKGSVEVKLSCSYYPSSIACKMFVLEVFGDNVYYLNSFLTLLFFPFHRRCRNISIGCKKLLLEKARVKLVLGFVSCFKMLST